MLDQTLICTLYDARMQIPEWVLKARSRAKLTQEELGDKLGVTKGAISHWENGRSEPSLQQLLQIEQITGEKWREQTDLHPVVVVGTARLGDRGYYEEISPVVGSGDGFLTLASKDRGAYALRLRGNSGFPALRDGWFAIVEPNREPSEGEYVLAKLKDGRRMVKEFLYRRSGTVELMSVNGQERVSIDLADLEEHAGLQSVGAIVPPSRWMPE